MGVLHLGQRKEERKGRCSLKFDFLGKWRTGDFFEVGTGESRKGGWGGKNNGGRENGRGNKEVTAKHEQADKKSEHLLKKSNTT